MRNQNISTHVAGNIASHDGTDRDSYAVGTWDGTVMICKDDMIEWYINLNINQFHHHCNSSSMTL